jgi:hypothetical protein
MEEVFIYKYRTNKDWKDVAETYISPSKENLEYQKLYNLMPHQLFLLDMIDDFIRLSSNPVDAQLWRDTKQEKLDDCAKLYKLKGAL